MFAHRLGIIAITLVVIAAASPPALAEHDAVALVKQLGSDSFQAREAAERQLKALGPAALSAIKAGVTSGDAEVAQRCKTLLSVIRKTEAEAFVAGKKEHDSPAWMSFKTLVGDSKESRQLFAEMMADDRRADAIDRAEANPAKAHEVYAVSLLAAKDALDAATAPFFGRPQPITDDRSKAMQNALREALPPAEIAAVLFLGRHITPAGVKDPDCPRFFFSAGFAAAVEGSMSKEFKKLFAGWLDRRQNAIALQAGLTASLNFALKEGVPMARRVLADKATSPQLVDKALLVIGHHGTQDDLPLLGRFRNDDRVTSTAHAPGPVGAPLGAKIGDRQVRDLAAAMSLQLAGQDFEKYGYGSDTFLNWFIRPGEAPFRSVTMIKSDEERAAALKKAWAWLDAQPKVEAVPPAP
jgi:hypothetical protein